MLNFLLVMMHLLELLTPVLLLLMAELLQVNRDFKIRFFLKIIFNVGDKYTAVYTYTAQYEDELSFEAGDTVTVVNKDEADWWKGECKGKTGVFPSNYVEPLKCKF